jgi:hypothetical protein
LCLISYSLIGYFDLIKFIEPPFYGENLISLGYNIVHKNPKNIPAIYSPKLVNFIMKLLDKTASTRPKISEILD